MIIVLECRTEWATDNLQCCQVDIIYAFVHNTKNKQLQLFILFVFKFCITASIQTSETILLNKPEVILS